jgi:hypothetical protein
MEVYWLGAYGGSGTPTDYPITGLDAMAPVVGGYVPPVGPIGQERYINDSGINNNPSAGSNNRVYLYARVQNSPNQSQCYCFGYETSGSRYVFCKDQTDTSSDGPTFTGWNATASAPTWSDGEMRTFEIQVNGSLLKAYVDDVEIFSETRTDYASGKTGFELKGGSSPVRGFHIDNFRVESLTAPPSPTTTKRNAEMLGVKGVHLIHGRK